MKRSIIILIILLACLSWVASPGAIRARSQPQEWQGQGRESVVSVVISSARIAFTWGMPAALIYQLRALLK